MEEMNNRIGTIVKYEYGSILINSTAHFLSKTYRWCKKQILEFQSWNKALWLFKNISFNFEQPIKMLYFRFVKLL